MKKLFGAVIGDIIGSVPNAKTKEFELFKEIQGTAMTLSLLWLSPTL